MPPKFDYSSLMLFKTDTMFLHCLTSIPHLWASLWCLLTIHRKDFVRPLPDDIIINILSFLPAECVLKFRRVCKQWLALTKTPYFIEMHLKRATSVLVQCEEISKEHKFCLYILDDAAKKGKMIKKIRSMSLKLEPPPPTMPLLLGSCNGLLLFRLKLNPLGYYVLNPITGGQIYVMPPKYSGYVCGFFFHPLTKEHRLLYVYQNDFRFMYFIHNLVMRSWRKVAGFSCWPRAFSAPAIVSGALHWIVEHKYYSGENRIPPCSNSIIIFDIDSESFRSMPHPGNVCRSQLCHEKMDLLEMEGKGKLSFCSSNSSGYATIDMWILEDYENWFWVRRYKINLSWGLKSYSGLHNYDIRYLNIKNDELLFDWWRRGLFRYHLGSNTVREVNRTWLKKMPKTLHYYDCETIEYVRSLVSPRGLQYV